jgi:hypothetical protein
MLMIEDEYFRYASMKWLASCSLLLFFSGLWTFCSGPAAISPFVYFFYVLLFAWLMAFLLLWFDLQYDMSTIL